MRSIIIVAGGKGLRMGNESPKQFLLLGTIPILMHPLKAFHDADPTAEITLVLPEDHIDTWLKLADKYRFDIPHKTIPGGETRFHSVKHGLKAIPDDGFVAVHDGVRPLIDPSDIKRLFDFAEKMGNAVPSIPVYESLRHLHEDDSEIVNRSEYRLVQTPQIFPAAMLKKAYETEYHPRFTDDASVFEASENKVYITEGNPGNIKITQKDDLLIAHALLRLPFQE